MRHALADVVGPGLDGVQTRMEQVANGDVFLLCTDGLHHMVPDRKIQEILESFSPESGACDRLIQEAIRKAAGTTLPSSWFAFRTLVSKNRDFPDL